LKAGQADMEGQTKLLQDQLVQIQVQLQAQLGQQRGTPTPSGSVAPGVTPHPQDKEADGSGTVQD